MIYLRKHQPFIKKLVKTKIRLLLAKKYRIQKHEIHKFFDKNEKAVLIILDACRRDVFSKNIGIFKNFDYRFNTVISSGSCTLEWMKKTFIRNEVFKDVLYVASNGYATKVRDKFKFLINIWDYGFDGKVATVRAETVNLAVKKIYRKGYKKMIVHYVQPHAPFIPDTWLNLVMKLYPSAYTMYEMARVFPSARREFVKAYVKNAIYVMENVKELLEWFFEEFEDPPNIVLTADHGEIFERPPILYYNPVKVSRLWRTLPYRRGLFKTVGHPCNTVIPELIMVPWVEIKGYRKK